MSTQRWDIAQSQAKIAGLSSILEGSNQKRFLILCHNNPDPDTLASAFGFSYLLQKKFSIKCVIGYGGVITRAQNKAMVHRLRIPVTRISQDDSNQYQTTALIDAQPLTGNNLIDSRSTPPLIVVDHHPLRKASLRSPFHDVRPTYGATSTIITEYLIAAEVTPSRSLANALLYGIKTDTNSLMRACCKADYHAFNYLSPLSNPRVLGNIEKPALPMDYFGDFQKGLSKTIIYRDVACSFLGHVKTDSIIPELADLLLRIEGVTWSLCMGEHDEMMMISLRSKSRTQKAGLLLRRLVGRTGSAGGHREMAGGQIPLANMSDQQRSAFPSKLTIKFLGFLGREHVSPKPLVPNE
ncbi:MAG: bifunctional oligoribonuclease/PAP phosphatase NrnA [Deltaproteobacteria bacterium]|nr:bifunctional oligoribonuclease/PAP phosphatase NrnA [Deltaproteobacteria bacterium]